MSTAYWNQVRSAEMAVPTDRPLPDLTAELTTMLGSTDPVDRDEIAYPILATWVSEGVYDDLLAGLGDGMAAGLVRGLGESGTDSVFRRSFSALVLAECIARDNAESLLPPGKILEWGDRVSGWLVRERDVRGLRAGPRLGPRDRARCRRAQRAGRLAASRPQRAHRGARRAGRPGARGDPGPALQRGARPAGPGHDDACCAAGWCRCGSSSRGSPGWRPPRSTRTPADRDPYLTTGNPEAFLRALHLQVALAPEPIDVRADLLLTIVDALRTTNATYLAAPCQVTGR